MTISVPGSILPEIPKQGKNKARRGTCYCIRLVKRFLRDYNDDNFLKEGGNVNDLFKLADPKRQREVQNGKKDWSLAWLLGSNFEKTGPLVGPNVPGVVVIDENGENKGRLLMDAGWVLGWAFNGDREGVSTIGDNLQFVSNIAGWLAGSSQ